MSTIVNNLSILKANNEKLTTANTKLDKRLNGNTDTSSTLNENINQCISDLDSIKSAIIRAGISVQDTNKTNTYGTKISAVKKAGTDEGKKIQYDAFWDNYQQNGQRIDYDYAFAGLGWTGENFKPKYNVTPQTAIQMFNNFSVIEDLTIPYNNINFDFTNCIRFSYCFAGSIISKIPKIIIYDKETIASAFYDAKKLTTITELVFPDSVTTINTTNAFYGCILLENITITGTIAVSDFDLHWSTKLTTASLLSILTALSKDTAVATGKKITLPTAAKTKIDADTACTEQYTAATTAGWNIVYS